MQKFNGSLIRQFPSTTTGNAASGVQVSVYISGTNTLATLYVTDNVAGAQLDNPLTTNDKGFYSFYAADGRYRLEFNNGFPALEEQLLDAVQFVSKIDDISDSVDLVSESVNRYATADDPISKSGIQDKAFYVADEDGRVALSIDNDGQTDIAKIKYINAQDFSANKNAADSTASFYDDSGNAALKLTAEGKVITGNPSRNGGFFAYGLNFINNAGQSLGEGSDGPLTTMYEYNNAGFPARTASPDNLRPLQISTTQVTTRGESPMYGALAQINQLIESENGITFNDNNYQMAACNNCYSGTNITDMSKGGVRGSFEAAIAQAERIAVIAAARGTRGAFQATFWTQGERDILDGTTEQQYFDLLTQLANDFNTDGKAATGQFSDVNLICYQTSKIDAEDNIAPAQLRAANSHKLIHMACPIYFMEFYDFQHINAESSRWLGGYYGIVYKRVVIDRKEWSPLQPVSHSVIGNTIDLFFNKSGLTLDTVSVPEQVNYGFSAENELGATVTVSTVSVIAPNRVRITLSEPIGLGYKIKYAHNSAIGRTDAFTGCCGNLRDNAGDLLTFDGKPLHNWSVIFKYEV